MNLSIPFFAAVAAAVATNFLDWKQTASLIKAKGTAGERNPLMRALMGKSKWLGLAYKMWPYPILVYFADFHFRDITNYRAPYVNAPGTDNWAIADILTALACAGLGLYGYLKSRKAAK